MASPPSAFKLKGYVASSSDALDMDMAELTPQEATERQEQLNQDEEQRRGQLLSSLHGSTADRRSPFDDDIVDHSLPVDLDVNLTETLDAEAAERQRRAEGEKREQGPFPSVHEEEGGGGPVDLGSVGLPLSEAGAFEELRAETDDGSSWRVESIRGRKNRADNAPDLIDGEDAAAGTSKLTRRSSPPPRSVLVRRVTNQRPVSEHTARRNFWLRVLSSDQKKHADKPRDTVPVMSREKRPADKNMNSDKLKGKEKHKRSPSDQFHDYVESGQVVFGVGPSFTGGSSSNLLPSVPTEEYRVPLLRDCQKSLHNEELARHRRRQNSVRHRIRNTYFNVAAAFYIYFINSLGFELLFVVGNAVLVTFIYCWYQDRKEDVELAVKLDFSFLAFAVVFPLTFLIQSTFRRRDEALVKLADFKGAVLSKALFTLTVDWPPQDGSGDLTGGRLAMPDKFNANVVRDCSEMIKLVYEYLSMPVVSHARHVVFQKKERAAKRVHALQNDIVKRINDVMVDFYMQTEVMRKYGFPSGEASRLHQYHQYIQQRFEQLKCLKYYRTPQATRSFGRAYIFILPWLTGPYYAWVFQSISPEWAAYIFSLGLAGFTYAILLGLLNTQQGLEDPFSPDYTSWTPGIDSVKLNFEMAAALQAIEQYYAQAELLRSWSLCERQRKARAEERR